MAQILNYECETCECLVEYQSTDMTEFNEHQLCKKCWEQLEKVAPRVLQDRETKLKRSGLK